MNTSPTPPVGGNDPLKPAASPAITPQQEQQEAEAFVRAKYTNLPKIPKTPIKPEADDFVADFTKKHGGPPTLTADKLTEIVKKVRKEMRAERPGEQQGDDNADESNPTKRSTATKIVIGAGIFAAVALLKDIGKIIKEGFSWEMLRPMALGSVAIAILIYLYDLGTEESKKANTPRWVGVAIRMFSLFGFCCLIVVVLLWASAFLLRDAGISVPYLTDTRPILVSAPKEFSYDDNEDYSSLPDELFGAVSDDNAQPRAWLEEVQLGTAGKLGEGNNRLSEKDVKHHWLLTVDANTQAGFDKGYYPFTAIVNVGTTDDVVILAFLIQPVQGQANKYLVAPLSRIYNANRAEYNFNAPESRQGNRLLIYVGMRMATFEIFKSKNQKFTIKS